MLRQESKTPCLHVVAATLEFLESEVEQTPVTAQRVRSLDAPFDDGEKRCFMDCASDKEQAFAEDLMLEFTLQEDIAVVLDGLSDREAEVLCLQYGLRNKRPLTLDQIGMVINLSSADGRASGQGARSEQALAPTILRPACEPIERTNRGRSSDPRAEQKRVKGAA